MSTRTVAVNVGRSRRTYLHVPALDPRPGAPLLLALHGTGQTGRAMRRASGRTLDHLAEQIGADLVYLDGFRRSWNDARRSVTTAARRKGMDDTGFVRSVIEHFARPTIVVGYSNGGQLVHRLLHQCPGTVSGAVIIAAGLPVREDFLLDEVVPDRVPVLLLHGTADPIVPYWGGAVRLLGRDRGVVRSAQETAATYAGAVAGSHPAITSADGHEQKDWPEVRLITQFGAGHVIPNRVTRPWFVGPSHDDLDLGHAMDDFFTLSTRLGA